MQHVPHAAPCETRWYKFTKGTNHHRKRRHLRSLAVGDGRCSGRAADDFRRVVSNIRSGGRASEAVEVSRVEIDAALIHESGEVKGDDDEPPEATPLHHVLANALHFGSVEAAALGEDREPPKHADTSVFEDQRARQDYVRGQYGSERVGTAGRVHEQHVAKVCSIPRGRIERRHHSGGGDLKIGNVF